MYFVLIISCILIKWIIQKIRSSYLWEDFKFFLNMIHCSRKIEKSTQHCSSPGMLDVFLQHVSTRPHKTFILYQDQAYSFRDIDLKSSQAAWALTQYANLKNGDCVAVYVGNEPAFIWLWIALAKLGCPMACLNCNIRSKSLLHCFKGCGAKILIAAPEFQAVLEEVLPALIEDGVKVFYLSRDSPTKGVEGLLDIIEASSEDPIPESYRSTIAPKSPSIYIYTSGTTGLPKAAVITHRRVFTSSTVALLCGLTSEDIQYIPIPLYHSAGLLIGVRGCIQTGATILLRKKFSSSQFWDDCRKYNVTAFLYIGEILRYLCNTCKNVNDYDHSIRLAIGNGVRPEVWKEFINRFGKIKLFEFYGATEGNAFFLNYTQKEGAMGRYNSFLKLVQPFEIIKFDTEKDEPVRDHRGRCIRVTGGETGLLIAKHVASNPFNGYAGKEETEKKKLYNVLQKGDIYFNTGDLVMMDKEGFIFFQDRVGDTFRWKGENVATTEIENLMLILDFIEDANAFGVPVPDHEGRIGMVSLKLKEGKSFDGDKIFKQVTEYLPNYARPRFVRIQDSIQVTATYKQYKMDLVKDGFNPFCVKDPLYILDDTFRTYRPMDRQLYNDILEKRIKL
ncbi:long-chain fatty acid transport protein 2-like [Hyla sarda]|uniref:long-chain fatty acid transport protein 2-like n=1 Tax=Hyla sarda TaxID=327740 RepID=UPI0024C408BD|nr:long-chain fatty acid transport protein 2-like [Hyla sarda]XP_056428570.1 long-chain fatty acid transport protein 2-like [Hyla sarda]XP_056428572.1 long-chain fatty acid transport protein 2-like [Hyla sarda]XP_056428573.1 long-chain fatty acid transport protein 2-like [Hyla sarda]XP_056428574.1 long-chain fatty acid transport protein 2-like [Hyla sarda]